jgi:hypothetical protein
VLVTAQRGIGSKQMASPPNWHVSTTKYLEQRTKRPVRVRGHPGNTVIRAPLDSDLDGAWACAIWSSSCGVKALTLGIPVLSGAPKWIAQDAAAPLAYVEEPRMDETKRLAALRTLAHAQWRVSEIETGEPFARIRDGLWAASW